MSSRASKDSGQRTLRLVPRPVTNNVDVVLADSNNIDDFDLAGEDSAPALTSEVTNDAADRSHNRASMFDFVQPPRRSLNTSMRQGQYYKSSIDEVF